MHLSQIAAHEKKLSRFANCFDTISRSMTIVCVKECIVEISIRMIMGLEEVIFFTSSSVIHYIYKWKNNLGVTEITFMGSVTLRNHHSIRKH